MNKRISKVILLTLILTILIGGVSFAKPIDVYYGNEKMNLHTEPLIMNGRVLVPMRSMLDTMHFYYEWDGKARTVYGNYDSLEFELQIGSKYAKVTTYDWDIMDEVTTIEELDAPPVIKNGYTLVPIRFVSECIGKLVFWDGATRSVYIKSYPDDYVPFPY